MDAGINQLSFLRHFFKTIGIIYNFKEMNGKRKLSAILFADIVGYTKLMQESENSGLDTLDKFKTIVNDTVPKFNGEVVKSYGDGCLMLFDVPSRAIQCAIDMQKAFRKGKAVPVRIGAHIGEVIQTEDDYYGDGINIASRLESLAEPNSILISRAMKDQIRNKEFANTEFIGTVNLKNVEDIQEIYALSNKGLAIPSSNSIGSEERPMRNDSEDGLAMKLKKKSFGGIAGIGIASLILFIGFGLIGIIPGKTVSLMVLLIVTFLVMMYFLIFGLRFDVYGKSADRRVSNERHIDEDMDEDQTPLDLKELDAQPRKYNKKDFI